MSSTAQDQRIDELLLKVDNAIETNKLSEAANALKEASHLDSNNSRVKDRWSSLQRMERGDDVFERLRGYLGSQQTADGETVLQFLRTKPLPSTDAERTIDLLLNTKTSPDLLDALTGAVLSRNIDAQKHVARKLEQNATILFEELFARGEASFNALVSIPLEAAIWSSSELQTSAQRGLFQLSVAKLMAPGAEHLERVMGCVARLLSLQSDKLSDIIDAEVFNAILVCLDLRLEPPLRSQSMMAITKLFEATKEEGEALFSHFIHNRVGKQTNDDLIIAFSAAAAVFPVIPAVASKLFLVEGFVQQLVPSLERNSQESAAGKRKSQALEAAALELLSAACVEKACRESIKQYCAPWLATLAEDREGKHKALAALILAKISEDASEDVAAKLGQLVVNGDSKAEQAIEGLAYTTLQGQVKEDVAGNAALLQKLVKFLEDASSVAFGCLTIFANLTTYRPQLSEEQKKMSQLKAYANSQQPTPEDPLDDDAHVTARSKKIMGVNIVPALVSCYRATSSTSLTNVALITQITLSLAREQRHRALMAQQGAIRLLLQIRNRVTKTDKPTPEAGLVEKHASHALARLLISVNPAHVFSATVPASSAVIALVPLLAPPDTDISDQQPRDLLPCFESLLALTNLASMDENSIRDLQLRTLWPHLEDHLLLSSNRLIQRASVELLCNLMASPLCVTKFVGDGTNREATRMQILLALADVEDLATRRAAGGALAMLTEWDAAVSTILAVKEHKGVRVLLGMCGDESDEMKHRGLACVMNVVSAPGDVGVKGITDVKEVGGPDMLKKGLAKTKNGEILSLGVEVLKKLV